MLLNYLQIIAYNGYGSNIAQTTFLNSSMSTDKEFLRTLANSKIRDGDDVYTYLLCAVERQDIEQVNRLLDLGARINEPNSDDWTPLMAAIERDNLGLVKHLFSKGATLRKHKRGWNPLYLTSFRSNPEMARYVCQKGIPVDRDSVDSDGLTCCMGAAWLGDLDLLEAEIRAGAGLETRSRSGQTALMLAAEKGNLYVMKRLIELGANKHMRDNFDRTVFSIADKRGHREIVDYLQSLNE